MGRHELTDAQWERLAPFLPPQTPRVGRPAHPHRRILNGILWILATGAPWRDLPACYGKWQTVSSRFYRWRRAGAWQRILAALQCREDRQGRLDWSVHFVDSTIVRAHQHAAEGGRASARSSPPPAPVRPPPNPLRADRLRASPRRATAAPPVVVHRAGRPGAPSGSARRVAARRRGAARPQGDRADWPCPRRGRLPRPRGSGRRGSSDTRAHLR